MVGVDDVEVGGVEVGGRPPQLRDSGRSAEGFQLEDLGVQVVQLDWNFVQARPHL